VTTRSARVQQVIEGRHRFERVIAAAQLESAELRDLPAELGPFGLKVETVGPRTRIAIDEKIGKQQRDLLRQLGYNDATRGPRSK